MSLSLGSKNENPQPCPDQWGGSCSRPGPPFFLHFPSAEGTSQATSGRRIMKDQRVGQTSSHTPGGRSFYSYLCPDTNQERGHHGEKGPGSSGPWASHPRTSGWSPGQPGSAQSHGDSGWATSRGSDGGFQAVGPPATPPRTAGTVNRRRPEPKAVTARSNKGSNPGHPILGAPVWPSCLFACFSFRPPRRGVLGSAQPVLWEDQRTVPAS